jgi:hypothetical protein
LGGNFPELFSLHLWKSSIKLGRFGLNPSSAIITVWSAMSHLSLHALVSS